MSTGYLGGGFGSVGDLLTTFRDKTPSGNKLLPLEGQQVDPELYPQLVAIMGVKPVIIKDKTPLAGLVTNMYNIAQSADGEYAYMGYANNLMRYRKSNNTLSIVNTGAETVGSRVACSADGQYVVHATGKPSSGTNDCKAYIYLSTDYGATFTLKQTINLETSSPGYYSGGPVWISRNGQRIVVASNDAYGSRYSISEDYGVTWVLRNKPNGSSRAVELVTKEDLSIIWIVETNGTLKRSIDKGVTFTTLPVHPDSGVDQFSLDPMNQNNIIGYDKGTLIVRFSLNSGDTWNSLPLPSGLLSVHEVHWRNGTIWLKAIQVGDSPNYTIYISEDTGGSWSATDANTVIGFDPHDTEGGNIYLLEGPSFPALYQGVYGHYAVLPLEEQSKLKVIADKV